MPRIGETVCWNPSCKQAGIAVHRSATGKLHSTCHKCGCNAWPIQGTKSHRDLLAVTVLDEAQAGPEHQEPTPAPKVPKIPAGNSEPSAKPNKATTPPNSVFSLGDL